jgi:HEPN domain-containing protein
MKPETLEWVNKAEGDYRTTKRELQVINDPNPDAVCFHAQQCVEKYLKAFLVESGINFPKTHNLLYLLDLLVVVDGSLTAYRDILRRLDAGSVQFRYPGSTASQDIAEELFLDMEQFRTIVRKRFQLE